MATEMKTRVLLGDEAVALGAIHAGVTGAYSYPGTPATEILEAILAHAAVEGGPKASWCANEKTAYETALGVSFAGRRALVSMKHVGLNVAADAFINSAIVSINGGLVLAVADDPGMHSSQNEQDSRFYADFAHVCCFEPRTQQEAYDMTREAFDLSERFHVPVVVRLVTRLAHSRAVVNLSPRRKENPPRKGTDPAGWILLPVNARRGWRTLLETRPAMVRWSERSDWNYYHPGRDPGADLVITAGIAANYLAENVGDLPSAPAHLHIGAYPLPLNLIRNAVENAARVLVLEDGQPFIESALNGVLPQHVRIHGRLTGHLNEDGELNPDVVRRALGLPERQGMTLEGFHLPNRPPQLCSGCPHRDSFLMLKEAMAGFSGGIVTSDIGCYTLAALPPWSAIESCVCMGASIGMARGAAEAGYRPVAAVIGDSTFLHSGMTALLDAVVADADIKLLILDNEATAMTGGQPPLIPPSRMSEVVRGLGVKPEHLHVLRAHPSQAKANTEILKQEMEHRGLSVFILVRECVETLKRHKKQDRSTAPRVTGDGDTAKTPAAADRAEEPAATPVGSASSSADEEAVVS